MTLLRSPLLNAAAMAGPVIAVFAIFGAQKLDHQNVSHLGAVIGAGAIAFLGCHLAARRR